MIGEIQLERIYDGVFGSLRCQGQTLLISEYPDLYAVIDTKYGGDGVTNFKIPNIDPVSDLFAFYIRFED